MIPTRLQLDQKAREIFAQREAAGTHKPRPSIAVAQPLSGGPRRVATRALTPKDYLPEARAFYAKR